MNKKTKVVYIAGSITKNPNYKEDFKIAREYLEKKGYIVLDPSFLPKGLRYQDYMNICFPMISIADTIYLLKSWTNSVGAKMEFAFAKQIDKEIIYEDDIN